MCQLEPGHDRSYTNYTGGKYSVNPISCGVQKLSDRSEFKSLKVATRLKDVYEKKHLPDCGQNLVMQLQTMRPLTDSLLTKMFKQFISLKQLCLPDSSVLVHFGAVGRGFVFTRRPYVHV